MSQSIYKIESLLSDKIFKFKSFTLMTNIVQSQVNKLGVDNLDSDQAIEEISEIIQTWSDEEFGFLLTHSCYIPDHYPETGSEETLFSKLVEYLVCEWGYDLELVQSVASSVDIPLIACGGVGQFQHFVEGIEVGASAVSAGNIFHFTELSDRQAKKVLAQSGVPVRV